MIFSPYPWSSIECEGNSGFRVLCVRMVYGSVVYVLLVFWLFLYLEAGLNVGSGGLDFGG